MSARKISVVTPCYNEEGNVEELYRQIKAVFAQLPQYEYEQLYIDNHSQDGTVAILRRLAADDPAVKVIVNARNFGHIRSPYHAFLEAGGDAVIVMVSDLQDPPPLIMEFLKKWEEGFKIVLGEKTQSAESGLMFFIRRFYYRLVRRLADVKLLENVTGFGLYDRGVIEQFRALDESYPYVRGLISELGYEVARIPYLQPNRKSGITKNNFYTLYDMAMLGFTSHSKVPLRLATMMGFGMSLLSLLVAIIYMIYKLIFWDNFPVGLAPMIIGLFLFSSVQLFFIGILGEYIGAIHTQVLHRPLVVEKERINF
ncbi:MAG: glycosyltransferase family 2 protein [Chthoniobacterales bacterium]